MAITRETHTVTFRLEDLQHSQTIKHVLYVGGENVQFHLLSPKFELTFEVELNVRDMPVFREDPANYHDPEDIRRLDVVGTHLADLTSKAKGVVLALCEAELDHWVSNHCER